MKIIELNSRLSKNGFFISKKCHEVIQKPASFEIIKNEKKLKRVLKSDIMRITSIFNNNITVDGAFLAYKIYCFKHQETTAKEMLYNKTEDQMTNLLTSAIEIKDKFYKSNKSW